MVSKLFLLSITKKNIRIEIIENLPPVSNKVIIQGMEIGPTKNIKKEMLVRFLRLISESNSNNIKYPSNGPSEEARAYKKNIKKMLIS